MLASDFHYRLPEELIAQYPLDARDGSRLLHLAKDGSLTDTVFKRLDSYLQAGDLLILNDTQVIPARLYARKESGGKVEIMLNRIIDHEMVLAQLRVNKKPRPGTSLWIGGNGVFKTIGRQDEMFILRYTGQPSLDAFLQQHGHMPLPPYINRANQPQDWERYQTVFSNRPGAVAAPTAGLHFTEKLLRLLHAQGIAHACLTLHVGAGTFKQVRVNDIKQHSIHSEYMCLSQDTVDKIVAARECGGRIVAVGTTVVRGLETAARNGKLQTYQGETDIFIYPGFKFNVVDMLLTNFHLAESTLLMLVCAFAGRTRTMLAYEHAVSERYRFLSYGDAMLIEGGAT